MSREVRLERRFVIAVNREADVAVRPHEVRRIPRKAGVAHGLAEGELVNRDLVVRTEPADVLIFIVEDVQLPIQRLQRVEVFDRWAPRKRSPPSMWPAFPLLRIESA